MKYVIKEIVSVRISKRGLAFLDVDMYVSADNETRIRVVETFTRQEWEGVKRDGYFIKNK